ncbi:ABC transporter permease [Amycolatopsis jejuensis]|uniref:ABC transporter permease n=1 Tax=Amycolatopsis jejuensis TaxID=330084 RepID=UPI00068E6037|nr:ABC transporter permease [Amycolatopsis jejuensis]
MTATVESPGLARPRSRRSVPIIPAFCALFLLAVIVFGIAGARLSPYHPLAQDPLLGVTSGGGGHLLGTDQLGRDALSQLLAGTQSATLGPLLVALGCLVVGASLGMAAAYFGGTTDTIVNGAADLIYALPALLIAIVVLGVTGGGYWTTAFVLLALSLPYEIRICRSAAMAQVHRLYIDAARTAGLSPVRIIFRQVAPNIAPTLVASFLLDFVTALIGFAALSYLGLGVPPGSPNWGVMLADGQSLIGENPWLSVGPAVLLIVTAASATLLGDWLHESLENKGERS